MSSLYYLTHILESIYVNSSPHFPYKRLYSVCFLQVLLMVLLNQFSFLVS